MKAHSTYAIVPFPDNKSGIITYRDIISLLGEQTQREIPVYIIGMPDDPFDAELIKSISHYCKASKQNISESRGSTM
jgi:hypothetical protein